MSLLWTGDRVITGRIAKYFTIDEIDSRGDLDVTPEMVDFLHMADDLREWAAFRFPKHAKSGLIISNCYRTEKHNKEVGGDKNSAHLDGRAMDITNVSKETYDEFIAMWKFICLKYNKIGGINLYKWGIHITDYENKFGHKVFQIRDWRNRG